jgi:hypothetical protein
MKLLSFRTAFTTARCLSVFWATWHESTLSNPILLRSTLILFLHVRLVLTSGLFPSPIRATCPAHLIVNLFIPQVSVAYKPSSLSPCNFHQLLHLVQVNSQLIQPSAMFRNRRKHLVSFVTVCTVKGKCNAVPLRAWSGPEGSRKLRFSDYMTTAQDGGKVVNLTHLPPLPPRNAPGTHFC